MRLGIGGDYEKIKMVKDAGFDYFEYNVAQLSKLTEEEYIAFKQRVDEEKFYAESMCVMLPPEIKVTGFDIDLQKEVVPYLKLVIKRAHGLGCKKIVFGSGRSRNMPEGFWDRRKAYDQIVEFLRLAAEMMEPYGMEIVIEPCPNPDNNILNFVAEGHYVMKLTDRKNVRLLADTYLMQFNYESLEEIKAYVGSLDHMHISSPDRLIPYEGDGFDYTELFRVINESGYDSSITIEAFHPETGCAERMAEAYRLLKKNLIKA
ncbi:MAG: sugar phosphate isomerase/epimerase [Clostridia bacterium]|nr:sugar phosphate isomerase/epimerase [Clostridia bacterium]